MIDRTLRLLFVLALSTAALWAACGDSDEAQPGGSDATSDSSIESISLGENDTTDAILRARFTSCTESRQCGGGEFCLNGFCREFCEDRDDCTSANYPRCDEETNACVSCFNQGQCTENFRCESQICIFFCENDDACGEGERCITETGRCTEAECTRNADCAGGERCRDGACEPIPERCSRNADCAGGEVCRDNECVAIGGGADSDEESDSATDDETDEE